MTNFVMASLFMNDIERNMSARLEHITAHTAPGHLRFVWGVGDSTDGTAEYLRQFADNRGELDIEIVNVTTGLPSTMDPKQRVKRKSLATSMLLGSVRPSDDYWIHHESDLISPLGLIDHLILVDGVCAGMVWLPRGNGSKNFYDTWAYRKDGRQFQATYPYHPCYNHYQPFEVDSVGSCFIFPAETIRQGLRCEELDVLELTTKLRTDYGYKIMVDPSIDIIQPADLFIAYAHAC